MLVLAGISGLVGASGDETVWSDRVAWGANATPLRINCTLAGSTVFELRDSSICTSIVGVAPTPVAPTEGATGVGATPSDRGADR